jgi:hypothetical protein
MEGGDMSEWTVDTLKEHMDVRFEAVKEAISKADAVGEQRAAKLETATQSRFESVNEFRLQTKDLQNSYMPRAEFDAALGSVDSKLDSSIRSMNEKLAAKNMQLVLSMGVGFVAVLIAVFNFAIGLNG